VPHLPEPNHNTIRVVTMMLNIYYLTDVIHDDNSESYQYPNQINRSTQSSKHTQQSTYKPSTHTFETPNRFSALSTDPTRNVRILLHLKVMNTRDKIRILTTSIVKITNQTYCRRPVLTTKTNHRVDQ
jgi:hypothetical protein